jgi:hypothetical protein
LIWAPAVQRGPRSDALGAILRVARGDESPAQFFLHPAPTVACVNGHAIAVIYRDRALSQS